MFRPDPNGEHSVEDIIAKLTGILADVPADSPRARKIAEMIRGLRQFGKEQQHANSARPAAGTD